MPLPQSDRSDKTEHFVANIDVKKVERILDRNVGNGQRERVVDDVTHIIVKADSLEKLKGKIIAHIQLIEED